MYCLEVHLATQMCFFIIIYGLGIVMGCSVGSRTSNLLIYSVLANLPSIFVGYWEIQKYTMMASWTID